MSSPQLQLTERSAIETAFFESPYFSVKYDSYFPVYERLFSAYRDREIVFVEVGVLAGGSLFMWRRFFGDKARIIGVEANPGATKWREHGFEIVVGDQSSPAFWDDFFAKIGPVDILLDDGGHRNHQQIVTTVKGLPHVKDGGMLVVEDVHTSYMRKFGNPSKYSFASYCKRVVDSIAQRSPHTLQGSVGMQRELRAIVHSIEFFESIVAFKVDRRCCIAPKLLTNGGVSDAAEDFRDRNSFDQSLTDWFGRINVPKRSPLVRFAARSVFNLLVAAMTYARSFALRAYFK